MRFLVAFLALFVFVFAFAQHGTPTKNDAAELKRHEQAYKAAKQAYSKNKSEKTKKAYVQATVRFGTASMTSPALDTKVKYRQALRLYNEALVLDPKNKEALNNKALIVSIYESMGRPVPKV